MRRRNADGIAWPPGLAVCDPLDWLEPTDDLADEPITMFHCWFRWTDARMQYLISLGVNRDDAQFESCGPLPNMKESHRG